MNIDFTSLFLQLPALGIVVWLVQRLVVAQQEHLKSESEARDRMLQRHTDERTARDKEWRDWMEQIMLNQEGRCRQWFQSYIDSIQDDIRTQGAAELVKIDRMTEELKDMRKIEDIMAKTLLEMMTLVRSVTKDTPNESKST